MQITEQPEDTSASIIPRTVRQSRSSGSRVIPAERETVSTTIHTVLAEIVEVPFKDGVEFIPADAHVPLLPNQSLAGALCFKNLRVVSNDYVVQFKNRLFQIQRQKRRRLMSPGTPIEVHTWLDDSLHCFTTDGHKLLVEEISERPRKNYEDALSA